MAWRLEEERDLRFTLQILPENGQPSDQGVRVTLKLRQNSQNIENRKDRNCKTQGNQKHGNRKNDEKYIKS